MSIQPFWSHTTTDQLEGRELYIGVYLIEGKYVRLVLDVLGINDIEVDLRPKDAEKLAAALSEAAYRARLGA
jgi:hypothetical protein